MCYSRIQNLSKISHDQNEQNEQGKQHSMAVVWILESKLSKVSTIITDMKKRRNELSVASMYDNLLTYRPLPPMQVSNQAHLEEDSEDELHDISPEKRLMLEKKNESFFQQLQEDMDQVVKTTQTLHEISSLQSTLSHHLSAQQEMIESINTDIMESADYMTNAHKQLKKTEQMFGQARLWVFIFLIVASFVLLFLDYYG